MMPAAVVMCAKPAAPESIAVRLTKPSNTDGNKPYCVTARTAQCAEPVSISISNAFAVPSYTRSPYRR